MHRRRGRACPALRLSASARLWDTRGPGMPGPYSVFTPVHDPGVPGEFVGDAYMRPGKFAPP